MPTDVAAADRPALTGSFGSLALGTIGIRCGGALAMVGMSIALGRYLGASDYGEFSLALAIAGLAAPLATAGLPSATTRFVAEYSQRQDPSHLRGFLRFTVSACLAFSVVAGLCLGIASTAVADRTISRGLLHAAVLISPLSGLLLSRKLFQSFGLPKASLSLDEFAVPVLVVLCLWAGIATTSSAAVLAYAAAAGVTTAGAILCAFLWRRSLWRGGPASYESKYWLRIAFPMVLGTLAQLVMIRTDIIMLGALSTPTDTGIYAGASRLASGETFVLGAAIAVITGPLGAAYYSRELGHVKSLLRKAAILSGLGAAPLLLVFVLAPTAVLGLFGEAFVGGVSALRLLAVGQFVNAVTGPVGIGLLICGRERAFAGIVSSFAVLNIIGNAIAIPYAGATGAAAVTALSVSGMSITQFAVLRRGLQAGNN